MTHLYDSIAPATRVIPKVVLEASSLSIRADAAASTDSMEVKYV